MADREASNTQIAQGNHARSRGIWGKRGRRKEKKTKPVKLPTPNFNGDSEIETEKGCDLSFLVP